MKKFLLINIIIFIFLNCSNNNPAITKKNLKISWKITTPSKQWHDMTPLNLFKGKNNKNDIAVNTDSFKQEIDGFGGSFNEKGWAALSLLTQEKKEEVIKALFDPENGARLNICRVPIGSSDYAISRYTLNETKNDYEMKNFSIERDKQYLIPYIKSALKYKPDLELWASAWTPPTWMKTNNSFDAGSMKDDPKIYTAYANYLINFIKSYQKEGIDIFAVAVQNEPLIDRNYPSCLWTPEQYLIFIRDYMGPLFTKDDFKDRIMLGTFQDCSYNLFPKKVLDDPAANSYVTYVGYQWDGLRSVTPTRENHPAKKIIQTETECGNWYWKSDFKYNPDFPQNDWFYGSYTWNKIKDFFDAGVNSYLLWNMILDEEGKSIDSIKPWPQNAAIVIDKNTKKIIYTPMYYAFKHFSYFIKPGAHLLDPDKSNNDVISFLNPDGEIIIILQNKNIKTKKLIISLDTCWFTIELPETSWSTIVVPKIE